MLKKLLLVVAALVALLAVVVGTRPNTYHVERSVTLAATPDVVFPEINELKRFGNWSPWDKLDPDMKKTYDGQDGTVGASYAWVGNKDVGSGKMTITESTLNQTVKHDLEFIEPFASKAKVTMSVASDGAGSKVTWAMDGENGFVSKFFGLFMDIDAMVGADFEKGLASLKTIGEDAAKKQSEVAAAAAAAAAAEAQAAADAATTKKK